MSRKEDQAFKEWGEALAAEVGDDEKEALAAWLALPVAREVFRGTLAQEKLYTELNKIADERRELEEKEAALDSWFEEEKPKNEKLLKERDQLKAQLAAVGAGDPPPAEGTPAPSLSPEVLAELKKTQQKLDTLDKLLPAVIGDVARMVKDSVENKFDIDPREAIKLSVQKGVEPWQAYQALTAEERQKRAEAAQEAERKKWFEEGRRSVTTNSPDHLKPAGPSVVDYLQNLNKTAGAKPMEASDRVSAALAALQEVDVNQLGG